MEERVVRPLRRVPTPRLVLAALPTLLAAVVLAWFALSTLGTILRLGGSPSFALLLMPLLALVLSFALPVLLWAGTKVEWRFDDDGFERRSGTLRRRGSFVLWNEIVAVALGGPDRIATRGPTLIVQPDPRWHGVPVTQPCAQMTAEGLAAVLRELLDHVPPDRLDPSLIVLEDLLAMNGGPPFEELAKARCLLERCDLERLRRECRRLTKRRTEGDPVWAWARMTLGLASYLANHPRQALEACAPLVAWHRPRREPLLCSGLAHAQTGDRERARRLLEEAAVGPRKAVVDAVVARLDAGGSAFGEKARYVMAVLSMLTYVALMLATAVVAATSVSSAWGRGALAFAGIALLGRLGLMGWEVVLTSRREAAKGPADDPSPETLPGPPGSSDAARTAGWVALALLVLGAAALGVTQLIGLLAPHLLAGEGGEVFAPRFFGNSAPIFLLVALFTLVSAVRLGALKRRPKVQTAAGPAPEAGPAEPSLNANLDPKTAIAAVGSAVLCAAVAMGLSIWTPVGFEYIRADAEGNVYAVFGRTLRRWDPSGKPTLTVDLDAPSSKVEVASDLAVGEDGTIYVADQGSGTVVAFDYAGRFVRRLAARDEPESRGRVPREWTLAVAPKAGGSVVLDAGNLASFAADGNRESATAEERLRYAGDVAVDASGRVFVADTANGRVVCPSDKKGVDCLGFADGFRYPAHVAVAPDGAVYAVLSRPWDYEPTERGEPLPAGEAPDVWMGRLYRLDFARGSGTPVDLSYRGRPININSVSFLPDGSLLVEPLSEIALYRADLTGAPKVTPFAPGELGGMLRRANLEWRIDWTGPQVSFGLAVVLPLGIGVGSVLRKRRRVRGS